MFPAFYQRNADIVEIQMLTGRDGVNWERLTREPMAPGGEPGTPSEGGYYAGSGLVSYRPGEVSLPISATWHTHNEGHYGVTRTSGTHGGHWSTATWRTDGFVSLEARDAGSFATVPITFEGGKLTINAWTRFGGEISFELADASGEHMGKIRAGRGRGDGDGHSWQVVRGLRRVYGGQHLPHRHVERGVGHLAMGQPPDASARQDAAREAVRHSDDVGL